MDIIVWFYLPILAFGFMMFFFAWVGSVIARRRIARLLQQCEIVLLKAEALGRRSSPRFYFAIMLAIWPWQGTLYLTNKRLIWRRFLFGYLGPAVLQFPLGTIDECSVRNGGWFRSLEITAGDEHLILRLYRHRLSFTRLHNRRFVEEIAIAINEARAVAQGANA